MRNGHFLTLRLLALTIVLVLGGLPAWSQGIDLSRTTGAPLSIYQGSDLDNVDLSNGNLRITIPLLHFPGRGLNVDVKLTYNSRIWRTDQTVDPYWGRQYYERINGGLWGLGVPQMGSVSNYVWYCVLANADGICMQWVDYLTWYRQDGTMSTLANDNGIQPTDCGGYLCSHSGLWSFDGSYIRFPAVSGVYQSDLTLGRYKNGMTVVSGQSLKDTNGNNVSCNSADTCTDTVGHVWNYNASADHTYIQSVGYRDSSGTTQSIAFTYQTFTIKYPLEWLADAPCDQPNCASSASSTGPLLTKVTLPNNLSYAFEYILNSDGSTTGEISKVSFPTGGYIRYIYSWWAGVPRYFGENRAIAARIVSVDGSPASEKTWAYAIRGPGATRGGSSQVTNPLGETQILSFDTFGWFPIKLEFKDAAGGLLKTINRSYQCDETGYNDPNPSPAKCSNPRIASETTTLNGTNQVSKQVSAYGTHGNMTRKDEYDWSVGAPGPLIRSTTFSYLHNANPAYSTPGVHILERVANEVVYDAGGFVRAQTTTSYDSAGLTPTSGVVQHDYSSHPSSNLLRGNPTQISRWNSTSATWLTTTNTYNDVGNLLQSTDPASHTTSFSYMDNFYNYSPGQPTSGYVTQVTKPTTNGVSHIERGQYYFNSGLLAASCGQNFPSMATCAWGVALPQPDYTTFTYDLLNRVKRISLPDGGQTSYDYNDVTPVSFTATTKITTAINMVTTVRLDGLGREKITKLGTAYTRIDRDALGRRWKEWNPTLCNLDIDPPPASCSGETTFGFTSYSYDALSRITLVIPQDGSQTSNNVSTTYAGNCTTVMDQVGKIRKGCTDGLGRLTQVFEPDANNNLVNETDYQYDVLGNLTCAVQKGTDTAQFTTCASAPATWRPRSFVYNSLSQLTSATNPESGTTNYAYNNDGVLITKTDARGIAINYSPTDSPIDALHRVTKKTYSNGDPAIGYFYDQTSYNGLTISNGIGRRTGMSDTAGVEAWSYDSMGRVLADRRTTDGVSKNTVLSYNLDGSMATLSYPSGRMITYTPDAAGRPVSGVDTANSINYATAASYAPQGTLSSLVLGQAGSFSGINLNQGYNNRLQPATIRAWSTNATTPVALDLAYTFDLSAANTVCQSTLTTPTNNGDVAVITNNLSAARKQTFCYDALNRISSATNSAWSQRFTYDIWGNLYNISAGGAPPLCVNVTVQNRFSTTCAGLTTYGYDAAGNMTWDGSYNYAFDAENRMKTGAGVNYAYDGDGKRLWKANGTQPYKLYWYGAGSDPIIETDAAGNNPVEYVFFGGKRIARRDSSGNVSYYFADHLGSSRVVTNSAGAVLDDSDFYPFGGERVVVSSSGNNYKFAGKERDTESGLDDFEARYYSSQYGRFVSPDEFTGGPVDAMSPGDPSPPGPLPYADIANPQSLNKYAYTYNNPLRFTDPNGHCDPIICTAVAGTIALIAVSFYDHFVVLGAKSEAASEALRYYIACQESKDCNVQAAANAVRSSYAQAGLAGAETAIALVPTTGVPTSPVEVITEAALGEAKDKAIEDAKKKEEQQKQEEQRKKEEQQRREEEAKKKQEEERKKRCAGGDGNRDCQ